MRGWIPTNPPAKLCPSPAARVSGPRPPGIAGCDALCAVICQRLYDHSSCRPAAPSPDLPWPYAATATILKFLTGDDKKPLRLVCKEACLAVDSSITTLSRDIGTEASHVHGAWRPWVMGGPRLPALRRLSVAKLDAWRVQVNDWTAADMAAAAALLAAHALNLRTLRLSALIGSGPEARGPAAAAETAFVATALGAAMPALERLELRLECLFETPTAASDAHCLELLQPLERLVVPRLTHLGLSATGFRDDSGALHQSARRLLMGGLPAVRHLAADGFYTKLDPRCLGACMPPRWAALKSLDLPFMDVEDVAAAFAALVAPTLGIWASTAGCLAWTPAAPRSGRSCAVWR